MEIITLRVEEILPLLNEVAELRIKIFREWPALLGLPSLTGKSFV